MTDQQTRSSYQFQGSKIFDQEGHVVFSNTLMPPYEKGVLLGTRPAPRGGTHLLFATDGDHSAQIFILDPFLTVLGHRPRRILSVPFVPTDILPVSTVTFGDECLLAVGHGLQSGVALIGMKSGQLVWIKYDHELNELPRQGVKNTPPVIIDLDTTHHRASISCGPDWSRNIAHPLNRERIRWDATAKLLRFYQRTRLPQHTLLTPEL